MTKIHMQINSTQSLWAEQSLDIPSEDGPKTSWGQVQALALMVIAEHLREIKESLRDRS